MTEKKMGADPYGRGEGGGDRGDRGGRGAADQAKAARSPGHVCTCVQPIVLECRFGRRSVSGTAMVTCRHICRKEPRRH
jgi:hypothetical protein